MIHLTDEQLNEYLDKESREREQIEVHLSSCEECAARLTGLKTLFSEIESLPEVTLSRSLAPRLTSQVPSFPRWLTLTATLQAAFAIITIIISAPFVMQFVSPYVSGMQTPSFVEIFLALQAEWMKWFALLSQIQMPTLHDIPVFELSSLVIVLVLASVSVLWIVGNGLLLRNQNK